MTDEKVKQSPIDMTKFVREAVESIIELSTKYHHDSYPFKTLAMITLGVIQLLVKKEQEGEAIDYIYKLTKECQNDFKDFQARKQRVNQA